MGCNNNNVAKFKALQEGIQIVQAQGYTKVMVEGDSKLAINMIIKILNDTPLNMISHS